VFCSRVLFLDGCVSDLVFVEGGEKFLLRKSEVELELHAESRAFADGLRHFDSFVVRDVYMYVVPEDVAVVEGTL
jgi:hypothetical protein